MSDNNMLVTLTKAELKQLIKDAVAEATNYGPPQEEELLSTKQAAKVFNPAISVITLHRWTKAGLIPRCRVRGRLWYKRSEIIAAAQTMTKYDRNKLPTA